MTAITTLVERLRDCAAWDPGDGEDEGFALLREAADAIDGLLAGIAEHRRTVRCCEDCAHAVAADRSTEDGRLWALLGIDDGDLCGPNCHVDHTEATP